jgi:hypothetical protein
VGHLPDATVPGRLVVSGSEVTWTVRGVRLRFPRNLVERAEVRRAPSQPGPVERELRAAGYP